ncbi:p33k [California sea lion adenovirus 1]|uniref:p33k n=1 Tax=California sea lion adenovirus 1 TaxID=943083 RepID=A0A059XIF4_9ADEN|nr:p33k [California sea lion adenovirus 1]AIA22361.1 p33k [California sea lion adenovirus 1]
MDPPQKQRFLPELSESETESEAESEVSCILETGEEQLEINQRPEEPVAKILKKPVPQNLKKRRWDLVPEADIHEESSLQPIHPKKGRKTNQEFPNQNNAVKALQAQIFPTLYATFQQIQAQGGKQYTIRNRTFRSLVKSCLYHQAEGQLRRTLEDAEKLFKKYCSAVTGV